MKVTNRLTLGSCGDAVIDELLQQQTVATTMASIITNIGEILETPLGDTFFRWKFDIGKGYILHVELERFAPGQGDRLADVWVAVVGSNGLAIVIPLTEAALH